MSSLGGSSFTKTELPCRDQDESQSESEARGHLLSDPSLTSVFSFKSGSKLKRVTPKKYHIRDTNQQVLVLHGNILVAVPDKFYQTGENEHQKTEFTEKEGESALHLP
ncbi:PREDICTED: interleukin-37-like [Chinchilla lanigera]|uniref:interleukin-37-like n=1 Tax=Chinchilla lanigera TaxID=34839 RepID=UPI0006962F99|nr:PREDICTED: interleukin-37-like [Chinchilla lanigera]